MEGAKLEFLKLDTRLVAMEIQLQPLPMKIHYVKLKHVID